MVEPEICFADLKDDMDLAEAMIKYTFKYVLDNCPEEMEFFNKFIDKDLLERLNHVINSDFARVTYTDAVKELENIMMNLNIKYLGVLIYKQNMKDICVKNL